jgi:signal transduction histidine kinase
MSGEFLLNWAIMAVSLFNTILLMWLGLMVLLNAERRTWGIWLVGGGLLMGGAFFVSHSAILGYGLYYVGLGTNFWWRVGWVPVIALPFVWYVVMLWYAGFWEDRQGELHRRQRPWLLLTALLVTGLAGLFVFANPLPSYWQVAQLDLSAKPSVGGIPLLILAYPLYILLCIALSLDALRRPGPSGRMMGDLARRRARPWLVAASAMLLAVSLLVAWVMLWIVISARQRALYDIYTSMSSTVAWFDLVISLLIALSVVLLGQATVAYEIFTGKTLPRRGLMRHWRRALVLAAGYGVVVGWGLTFHLRSIYSLLLTTMLMTFFYALLSWRSYVNRERYIDHLRPFVASQRLYEHLLASSALVAPHVDVMTLFQALCKDVLDTRMAYLAPLGPLTPLVGSALAFPDGDWVRPPSLAEITGMFDTALMPCASIDPARYDGAMWAVPLWSQHRLMGVLLLGEKRDGGLYMQEEIEVAQASGERLMDTLASAEIAQRLMVLQRQRLTESQSFGELSRAVFDQRARRLLHDNVLPVLHTAMLTIGREQGEATKASSEAMALLADAHRLIADLLREMPATVVPDLAELGLLAALRRVVDDEVADAFDEVSWRIEPEAEGRAQSLPSLSTEVLFYASREAIRNAARHGCAGGDRFLLRLHVEMAWVEPSLANGWGGLEIRIEDNGVGLECGSSTPNAGQGLALHSTMLAVIGGTLSIDSVQGEGTRVVLAVPREVFESVRQ